MESSTNDAKQKQQQPQPPPRKPDLPMGWTQIRRRPPATIPGEQKEGSAAASSGGATSSNKDVSENSPTSSASRAELYRSTYCCPDPTCFRNLSQVAASASSVMAAAAASDANAPTVATLQGTSILLLPSIDCTWFQGHFVPKSINHNGSAKTSVNFGAVKPIGLLAVERTDTDECMLCRDGGYREVDLTVIGPSSNVTSAGGSAGTRKRRVFERTVCTGGDMIRLRAGRMADMDPTKPTSPSVEGAAMDAERILTGRKAAPFLLKYFSSVVDKLLEENGSDEENEVSPAGVEELPCKERKALEVLPDCAVVLGDMIMTVPVSLLGGMTVTGNGSAVDNGTNNDDDDGWMSD